MSDPTKPIDIGKLSIFPTNMAGFEPEPGMDIRTYLAGCALQGLLAHVDAELFDHKNNAQFALSAADALIVELSKRKENQ